MTSRPPEPDPTPPPTTDPDGPRETVRGVARATVDVAAPPERVFDALTDPAELAAWGGGGEGITGERPTHDWRVDARPGGRWSVRTGDASGREAIVEGEFRVVDPPRTLETSWRASWDAAPSVVRYDLAPAEVGGAPGTRVTVTHTGPQTRAHGDARMRSRPAWAARPRRRADAHVIA